MNSGHRRVAFMHWQAVATTTALMLIAASTLFAYEPRLSRIDPPGVQRGTQVTVKFLGDRLNDPEEVVLYDTGMKVVEIKADEPNKKDGRVRVVNVTLQIEDGCRLGEHRMRLRTKSGWTHLQTLYVGAVPTVKEVEPNDAFDKPQAVLMNHTVEGVMQNEDIDFYIVKAKKGQRITAEVEGIRLGERMFDPYVAILDMERFELAASDDTPLLRQDAFVSVIAPADGAYVVAVRESAYGGNNARYRVHIGDFPRPTAVYPAGGRIGESLKVTYLGDPKGPIEATVKLPDEPTSHFAAFATNDSRSAPSPNWLRVSDLPNVLESEPNNNHKEATAASAELGTTVAFNGIIETPGDQDWFRFTGKKGQRVEVRVYARSLRTPLDPVINLYQADPYKHIKGDDDDGRGDLDGNVRERLPADGEYVVRVRDHLGKGGEDYVYRLEITSSEPSLRFGIPDVARYDTQSRQWAAIPKGNFYAVKLQASRSNFGGDLKVLAENLPKGVKMHALMIPSNTTEGMAVFEATADAPIGGAMAKLWGHHTDESKKISGEFRQRVELVQGNPNRTNYYSTTVSGFPVAVTDEVPFRVRIIEPKVPLLRSGMMYLKVVVDRKEGFDAPITMELPFRPPGVGASSRVTIGKGKTEANYRINANGRAAVGDWTLAMTAKADMPDGGDLYVATPPIKLSIKDHMLTGSIEMAVTEQGKDVDVICKLNPQEGFDGEAELQLAGLPNKCTAEPVKVSKGDKQVVFRVKIDEKASTRLHKSLFCQLKMEKHGEPIVQSLAGGGRLRIDKPRPKPTTVAKKDTKKKDAPKKKPAAKPLSRLEQLRLEREQQSK